MNDKRKRVEFASKILFDNEEFGISGNNNVAWNRKFLTLRISEIYFYFFFE